jgi:SAM-dependent methyltransferase
MPELGVENIEFYHGDLLDIGKLGRHFDMISCSGVLVCIDEPETGLKTLVDVLKPGGYIHLALYSETARQDVVEARRLIREKSYDNNENSIREFRHNLPRIMGKKMRASLMEFRDFFTMSECRDLIFHVNEHRHSIDDIKRMLTDNRLTFLNFTFRNPQIIDDFLHRFPDDEQGQNLSYWQEFEQKNPRTFVEMYDFWARKPGTDST